MEAKNQLKVTNTRFYHQKDTEESVDLEDPTALKYTEVMDVYSLHYFLIRRGRTLHETPEFQSYKRTFINEWKNIEGIIEQLEEILKEYDIKMV